MYVDDPIRGEFGVKVAVRLAGSYETVEATRLESAARSRIVLDDTVAASTARLNTAVTGRVLETPVAPAAGTPPLTESGAGAGDGTVNDQLIRRAQRRGVGRRDRPSRRAVYVPGASGADGVSVAACVAAS